LCRKQGLCLRQHGVPSELLVARKHTRFGQTRFQEAICQASRALVQFREVESQRIRRFQHADLADVQAESIMLRAYERDVISHLILPRVLKEWRAPSFEEFSDRNAWSLLNASPRSSGNGKSPIPGVRTAHDAPADLLDQEVFPAAVVPPAPA